MLKISHAMILAAGRGERLRPITDTLPKPLVEVGGRSMLDRQLDMMAAAGVLDAVVNCSWLAEKIQAHLAMRDAPKINISHEVERLETGGGILKALPQLGVDPFFVSNADVVVVDVPARPVLQRMLAAWDDTRMDALLLLQPLDKAIGFEGNGDFFLTESGAVQRRGTAARAPYVYTGLQILHPRLFEGCTETGAFSLNVLYNKGASSDGVLPRIHGIVHEGDWLHVGDAEGLRLAQAFFDKPSP